MTSTIAQLRVLGIRPKGVVLNDLAISATTFSDSVAAGAVLANIIGKTPGSTISIVQSGTALALNAGQSSVIRGLGPVSDGTYFFQLVETLAGAINSGHATTLAFSVTPTIVIPPTSKLTPSSLYTGVEASGFDVTGTAAFAEPQASNYLRTTAQSAAGLLNVDRTPFTADLPLVIPAHGKGGTDRVDFIAEGTRITVTQQTWSIHNDINGVAKSWFGFTCTLDHSAFRTVSPMGAVRVYAVVWPKDTTQQPRLLGPYTFYPRLPSTDWDQPNPTQIGPQYEYDKLVKIDPSATEVVGSVYNNLVRAMAYFTTNTGTNGGGLNYKFPLLRQEVNGSYKWDGAVTDGTKGGASAGALKRETWITIRPKTGVTKAVIGDGSANRAGGVVMDAIRFAGSALQFNLLAISPNGSNIIRLQTGSNYLTWFDGCEVTGGSAADITNSTLAANVSGSGAGIIYDGLLWINNWITSQSTTAPMMTYYTDCNIHDLPQYGPGFSHLVRCCLVDTVSGSALENCHGLVFGNTVKRCDAQLASIDLRTDKNALTLKLTGAGSATASLTNNVGTLAVKAFASVFVNGVPSYPVPAGSTIIINGTTITAPAGGWAAGADVIAAINAASLVSANAAAVSATYKSGVPTSIMTTTITATQSSGKVTITDNSYGSGGFTLSGTALSYLAINPGTYIPKGRVLTFVVDGTTYTFPTVMITVQGWSTKVADLVTWANGGYAGSPAISGITVTQVTQGRAACFLHNPSQTTPSGPTTNFAFTSGGATLTTWCDVHADALVWHGVAFSNVLVMMNRFLRLNCSNISFAYDGSAKDLIIAWNEFMQLSDLLYPSTFATGGWSGSYLQTDPASHVWIEYYSERGGNQFWGKGTSTQGWVADKYSGVGHASYEVLTWSSSNSNVPDHNTVIDSVSVLQNISGLPVYWNGTALVTPPPNSKMQASGVTRDMLYASMSDYDNPDFTPNAANYLKLADNSYAGSRDALGNWNGLPAAA